MKNIDLIASRLANISGNFRKIYNPSYTYVMGRVTQVLTDNCALVYRYVKS